MKESLNTFSRRLQDTFDPEFIKDMGIFRKGARWFSVTFTLAQTLEFRIPSSVRSETPALTALAASSYFFGRAEGGRIPFSRRYIAAAA